jgi:hypothetical protein
MSPAFSTYWLCAIATIVAPMLSSARPDPQNPQHFKAIQSLSKQKFEVSNLFIPPSPRRSFAKVGCPASGVTFYVLRITFYVLVLQMALSCLNSPHFPLMNI